MSIQKKKRKIDGKEVTYYYPVISTYKIDKNKTPLWGKGFPTQAEAIVEEARMKRELQKSPYAKRLRSVISFQDIKGTWLETRKTKDPATSERDADYCRIYLSVFDDLDIRKISAMDIQDWVTLLSENYAPKTVAMAFNLLSQIMEYAIVPLRIIKENPCRENIQRPTVKKRKIESLQYWTESELKYFLGHPLTKQDLYYRMYLIHSSFGMRPGEICGISLYDVSLESRRLSLNHGVDKKGRITDLKNSGAQRTLSIPQQLLPVFEEQIECSNILRAEGESYPFLFITNAGTRINPDTYCQHFQRLILRINKDNVKNKTGIYLKPLTPYGLRHTFATLSIYKQIPIKVIAEIMGDSVETILNNYVHLPDDSVANSLELFADQLLN